MQNTQGKQKNLLLIDAHALIHRAYHALPPLSTPGGEPIGAIYGLASILLKALRDIKPDYVAAAFDRPEPTFRKELYEEYKAHRPKTADELVSQLIKSRELFGAFDIKTFELAGYEADDIIGTLAKKLGGKETRVVILTGDLDTLQLVSKQVVVRAPKKGISETIVYDEAAVKERFGLTPAQMTDYKGLVGDPSDNIPGVRGVGPKTAEKILVEFGTLENFFRACPPDHPLGRKILPHKKDALFSKKLAVIETEVPIETGLDDLGWSGIPDEKIIAYFTELGFQTLVDRLLKTAPAKPQPFANMSTSDVDNFEKTKRGGVGGAVFFADGLDLREHKKDLESGVLKVGWDWKNVIKKARGVGIEILPPIFDLKIAGWLIDPDRRDLEFEDLARRLLRREGNPKNKSDLHDLFNFFKVKIKEYGLEKITYEIEMPLVEILASMESWGIGANPEKLSSLKKDVDKKLVALSKKIFDEGGVEFNISSPKQVGEIIFDKLGIGSEKKTKKTAGGQRSTAEDVLTKLRGAHPIIPLILEYRENAKILNTYIGPLLALAKEGRVHTTLVQTGTGTGRLSSEKPNLQNIPQESEWAPRLRRAFEAEKGWSFVSFDYSQLELRLLAHLTGDAKLIEAFHDKEDIHALTASQIFGVPKEKVDVRMRRIGKTLNFGIIYGMGPRAFAETSGISFEEADGFIKEYVRRFPSIKLWHEKIKADARTLGFVANENGRRRWFFGINSPNPRLKSEAERAAINMPTQSLGADIMKLGVIKSAEALKRAGLWETKTRLLLSIHDELLFEISDDILKKTVSLLHKILDSVYALKVPLGVDVRVGKTWGGTREYKDW